MFERYTEKARRVVFFSRYEATAAGSPYIETEHFLLGLIWDSREVVGRALGSTAVCTQLEKTLRAQIKPHEKILTSVDLPLSHECKRVLAYAAEEAELLKNRSIDVEHLLLGLLRESECVAAKALRQHGADLLKVRERFGGEPGVSEMRTQDQRVAAARARLGKADGCMEFVHETTGVRVGLTSLPLTSLVPRVGEEVVVQSHDIGLRAFRVRDVTYVFQSSVEGVREAPQKLTKIVVRVQPVEPDAGASWRDTT